MIFALVVLSISLLISILFIISLYDRFDAIRKELDNVKSSVAIEKDKLDRERKKLDNLISIEPGDICIIPDYHLIYNDENIKFKVTYEVEVVEVTKEKLKVNAINFTSNDSITRDPQKRNGIIKFLQDAWVDRSSVELVMDTRKRRNIKLDEIGI